MKHALYDWAGLNAWLFHLINSIHGPAYDRLMLVLTSLGDHHNFVYFFGLILALMILNVALLRLRGKKITPQETRAAFALLGVLVLGYALLGLITGVLKTMVHLPRPFVVFAHTSTPVSFIGAYPEITDYNVSFPSGHAALICFLVAALWPVLPRWACGLAAALAFAVCWSRLAIGMHFPADVIGGALIGIAIAVLVRRYVYRMLKVDYTAPKRSPAPLRR